MMGQGGLQDGFDAALLASLQDGLVSVSLDGTILQVNGAICSMTGFGRDELLGRRPPFPFWLDEEAAELTESMDDLARGTMRGGEFEMVFRTKDGRRFPVLLTASVVRDGSGAAVGNVAIIKDLTERRRAETTKRAAVAEQTGFHRIATLIGKRATPEQIFALVAFDAAHLLQSDCGLVARFDGNEAIPVGWWGGGGRDLERPFPLRGAAALARVHETGEPARVEYTDLTDDPVGGLAYSAAYRTGIAAPIHVAGRLWGALLVATRGTATPSAATEERLSRFAKMTALAVRTAESPDPTGRERTASIRLLARTVDARDPTTQRHSERVGALAEKLALIDGWNPERAALLGEAGLVHDVGKIGVPDAILFKPGRLDEAEYAQVKEHAALGAEIVAEVLDPEQVRWVRGHHERFDGAGYPDFLGGDEISDGARLLSLADAWDAMTVARPYGRRRSARVAFERCRSASGSQFDPEAVTTLETALSQ